MSSKNLDNLMIPSSQSALLAEIQDFINANKVILPFARDYFSCQALSNADNIIYLDLAGYQEIEEYSPSDKTISIQCGIKIKQLNEFLSNRQQWLPLTYSNAQTSLLELILSGYHGPYESLFGGLRRHLLGLLAILGSGQLIKCGGKVVKNVSGYDLTRFLIGSYGYFAIPLKAHLRFHALPEQFFTLIVSSDNLECLLTLATQANTNQISLAYADIFDSRLLKNDFLDKYGKANNRYILAMQIYANTGMIEEGARILKQSCDMQNVASIEITDKQAQDDFLQFLTQLNSRFSQNNLQKTIDLVVTQKECLNLLADIEFSSFPFLYRPLAQKFYFCLDNCIEQTKALNTLTGYAKEHSITLSVSYGNDQYLKVLNKLGIDSDNSDIALTKIKERLKSYFDPQNIFNPFVKI